jgi:hypothetical protein
MVSMSLNINKKINVCPSEVFVPHRWLCTRGKRHSGLVFFTKTIVGTFYEEHDVIKLVYDEQAVLVFWASFYKKQDT